MKNDLILSGNVRDLGGFSIVRSIPQAKKRHVGPFVFLDHLGPMQVDENHHLDVRPHPHIGLATVTYLFEGRVHHRDSIGSSQIISPGDLNWMTAGSGIVHSERTPPEEMDPNLSHKNKAHGIQIWIGLPVEFEECAPQFTHYPKALLPDIKISAELSGKLLIGHHQGATSPVKTFSPAIFMDLIANKAGENMLNFQMGTAETEIGIFLISGECRINGNQLAVNDVIIVSDPAVISMQFSAETKMILIGGRPFPEPRHIWWNFVSSRKERIEQAALAWKNQTMGKVPGEVEFIPLPSDPLLK